MHLNVTLSLHYIFQFLPTANGFSEYSAQIFCLSNKKQTEHEHESYRITTNILTRTTTTSLIRNVMISQ